jgi:hypothetical protein
VAVIAGYLAVAQGLVPVAVGQVAVDQGLVPVAAAGPGSPRRASGQRVVICVSE